MTFSNMEFTCNLCKREFPQTSRTRRKIFCDNCRGIRHQIIKKIHSDRIMKDNRIATAERKKHCQMRREQGFSK